MVNLLTSRPASLMHTLPNQSPNLSEYTATVSFWFYNVIFALWWNTFKWSRQIFSKWYETLKNHDDAAVVVQQNGKNVENIISINEINVVILMKQKKKMFC